MNAELRALSLMTQKQDVLPSYATLVDRSMNHGLSAASAISQELEVPLRSAIAYRTLDPELPTTLLVAQGLDASPVPSP